MNYEPKHRVEDLEQAWKEWQEAKNREHELATETAAVCPVCGEWHAINYFDRCDHCERLICRECLKEFDQRTFCSGCANTLTLAEL